jgi:hypothetical protein
MAYHLQTDGQTEQVNQNLGRRRRLGHCRNARSKPVMWTRF